jgi:hypothetical protein
MCTLQVSLQPFLEILRRLTEPFSLSFQSQKWIGYPGCTVATAAKTDHRGNIFTPPGSTSGIAGNCGAGLEDGAIRNRSVKKPAGVTRQNVLHLFLVYFIQPTFMFVLFRPAHLDNLHKPAYATVHVKNHY